MLTYELCRSHGKPHQLVDMITFSATEAARLLWDFLEKNKIAILNVAGPRASECPDIYPFVFEVIAKVLKVTADA